MIDKPTSTNMDAFRSSVRPIVTFTVVGTYLYITSYTIIHLLSEGDQTDNALALLTGVSGIATGIVGFWFGSRGQSTKPALKDSNRNTEGGADAEADAKAKAEADAKAKADAEADKT